MTRVAAIDCGTNSLRLLIADRDADGSLIDVERRMEIVRLGQGVDSTGKLADDALDRTYAVLREYKQLIDANEVLRVRMVATSASRDASNGDEFRAGVKQILGISPEIISGETEAGLAFRGATAGISAQSARPPFLVVDIGGGSTEFILGDDEPTASESLNIGSVRITERFFRTDPPDEEQIEAATAYTDAMIAEVARRIPVGKAGTMIGVAGSITTVTAMSLDLDRYDPGVTHGAVVTAAVAGEIADALLAAPRSAREEIGVLHPGRVDVIAAGALILSRVMAVLGFDSYVTSERDILDGIALAMP